MSPAASRGQPGYFKHRWSYLPEDFAASVHRVAFFFILHLGSVKVEINSDLKRLKALAFSCNYRGTSSNRSFGCVGGFSFFGAGGGSTAGTGAAGSGTLYSASFGGRASASS